MSSPTSPQLSSEEFEKTASETFLEYFDHGDTGEVASTLTELSIKNSKHEVGSKHVVCSAWF